jgi:biopolymer transport protein ExbD
MEKRMKTSITKFISVTLLSLIFVMTNALAMHHKSAKLDIVETATSNPDVVNLKRPPQLSYFL